MENEKLCPFTGMQPCNNQCALYDAACEECSLTSQMRYEDIEAAITDDDNLNKLADKISDALTPALEEILKAIVER